MSTSIDDLRRQYRSVWNEMAAASDDRYRELRPTMHQLADALEAAEKLRADDELERLQSDPRRQQLGLFEETTRA
ncbi:hypothetical protein J2T57_002644 [Natronocella acetinitrilica]|uniref:Uncharacterized protein n=1 Tax=Natronocella acetinitrilica TaxID=414046 RepID=A0AAE3G5N6_9GAMM|nr:hypothetical protein [Natronocella acetinitrilica]MCP1675494.1 hypothetical protein [Natronocella acetinitrilica]